MLEIILEILVFITPLLLIKWHYDTYEAPKREAKFKKEQKIRLQKIEELEKKLC
jgi:hypothetical protein